MGFFFFLKFMCAVRTWAENWLDGGDDKK